MHQQDQDFLRGHIAGIVTVLAEIIKALPMTQAEKVSFVTQFNVHQISKDPRLHTGIHAFLGTLAEELDR